MIRATTMRTAMAKVITIRWRETQPHRSPGSNLGWWRKGAPGVVWAGWTATDDAVALVWIVSTPGKLGEVEELGDDRADRRDIGIVVGC